MSYDVNLPKLQQPDSRVWTKVALNANDKAFRERGKEVATVYRELGKTGLPLQH